MSGISVVINSSGRRNVISNPPPPMEREVQSFSEFSSNLPFSVWTPHHVMGPQFYKHPNHAAPMLPPHPPYYDDYSRQMVASNLIVLTSEKVQKNSRLMTSPVTSSMTSSSDGVHSYVRRKSKEDCLSKPTKKRKFECGGCYDSSTRLSPCEAFSAHSSRAKRHASSRRRHDDKSKSLKDKQAKHRKESRKVNDSHRESGELTSSSVEEQNIKQFVPSSKRRKVRTHVSKPHHQHSKIHPSPLHKAQVDLYNFSSARHHGNRNSRSPRRQRSEDRSVFRYEEDLGRQNSSQESGEMSSADNVSRSVSSSSPKKKVSSSREKEKHRNKKHSPPKQHSHRTRRRSSHRREHDRKREESKDTDHNSKHKKQDKEKEIVECLIDRKETQNARKKAVLVLPDSTTVGFERTSPSIDKHDEVTKPEVTQCNQTNSETNETSSPTKILSNLSIDNSITSSTDQTTVVSYSSIDPKRTNSEVKVPPQNIELYVKILKILENEEKLGKLIQDSGLLIKNQEISAKKPLSPSGPVFHVNFDVEHPELDKQIDKGVDIDGLADIKNGTSCAIMGLKQSNSLQISEQASTIQSNIEDVSESIDAATIDINSSLQNGNKVSIEGSETLDEGLNNFINDDMVIETDVVPGASFMETTSDDDVEPPVSSVSTPTLELDESTDLIICTIMDNDQKEKNNAKESPGVMDTNVESHKDVGNIANKQSFVKLQFPAAKITLNEKDVKPRMTDSCCCACRLLNRPLVDPRVGSHSKMYADNLLKRCLVCFKPVDPNVISTSCYKDLKVEFYVDKNEVGVGIPCWKYTYTDDVQHVTRVTETNQFNLDLHLPHTPNIVLDESLVEKQLEVAQLPVSHALPTKKVIKQEPSSSLHQKCVEPQTLHDPPADPTNITPPPPNPTMQSSNHPKPMETCQPIMLPAEVLNILLSEQPVLPPATSTIPSTAQSDPPQAHKPLKRVSTTTDNQPHTPLSTNQSLATEQTSKPQHSNQSSALSTKATEPPKKSSKPITQTLLPLHKPSADYTHATSKTAPHTNQPPTKLRRSPPLATLTPNASTLYLNTPSSNQSLQTVSTNNQPTKSLQTNPPFMKATPPPRVHYIPLSQIPLPSNTPRANQSHQTLNKQASQTNQSLTKAALPSTTSFTQTSSALPLNMPSANQSCQVYKPSKAAHSLGRSPSPPNHTLDVQTSYLDAPSSNQRSCTNKPEPYKSTQGKSPLPTHTPIVSSSSNQIIQAAEATTKQTQSKSPNPQPKQTHSTTKPMKLTQTLSASNTPPTHPTTLHKSISLPHSTNLSIFHHLPFIDELPTITPRKRSQERTKPNKLNSCRSVTPDSQPTRTSPKEIFHPTTNSKPVPTSMFKTERINLFDKFAADITPPVSSPTHSPLPAAQGIPTPLPYPCHPSTTTQGSPNTPRNLHQASTSYEKRFNFKPSPSENRPNQSKPYSPPGVGSKTPPVLTPLSSPKTPPSLTLLMQTVQSLTPQTANTPTAPLPAPPSPTEHTLTPPPRTPTSPNDGISDEDIFDVSDTSSSSWTHHASPCNSMDVSPTSIAPSPTPIDLSPTTPPCEQHPNPTFTPTTPYNVRHTTIDDNGKYFRYNNQVYSWPFHGELDFNEMSDDDESDDEVDCGKYDVRVDLTRLEEDGFIPKCFATEIMGHSCCTCCHVYCCTSPWVAINGDDSSEET